MADRRTISELSRPTFSGVDNAIVIPRVEADSYEIKPSFILLVQKICRFDGYLYEDSVHHITKFRQICATLKIRGVTEEAIRLIVFPFSLGNGAKAWLHSLPARSITTWDDLVNKFLCEYFPPLNTTNALIERPRGNGDRRTTRDYILSVAGHAITIPAVEADSFKIKPSWIEFVLKNCQFDGYPYEDPKDHITNFLQICDLIKLQGVTEDAIRLILFPFSLGNQAEVWLDSLHAGSITTWDDVADKFLCKYQGMVKQAENAGAILAQIEDLQKQLKQLHWETCSTQDIDYPTQRPDLNLYGNMYNYDENWSNNNVQGPLWFDQQHRPFFRPQQRQQRQQFQPEWQFP